MILSVQKQIRYFYLAILANKQNKIHVHLNDTKPLKDDL